MEKHNKQDMIDALVRFSIESVLENRDWLEKIFADGIAGFNRLSETQLMQEMRFRGLLDFEDEPETLDDEEMEDDEDLDEEVERLVLWSGMVTVEGLELVTE
jgi:hypothetical protein